MKSKVRIEQSKTPDIKYDITNCFWTNFSDSPRQLDSKEEFYRVGPAPRDEWYELKGKSKTKPEHLGNLDCDDTDSLKRRMSSLSLSEASTHTKAIMNYFSRMASNTSVGENLDYMFLHYLVVNGAKINVTDKYGQTVMHEVARNWNTDVLKFLIHFGGNVNQPDHWGRTPLHLAAATNHAEMLDFLLRNGGDATARTYGENQAVIHYATKFDSVASIKVLVEHKVDYNVRDYKGRTPIFLAAEMACEDAAKYLLDIGVRVGVFDDSGMAAIGFMIQKMPHVAYEALDQFYHEDNGKRKGYYYLNYLEHCPRKWAERKTSRYDLGYGFEDSKPTKKELKEQLRLACPTTPLEIAVKHDELKVIMHPVMQKLIKTKWEQFGKFGAVFGFIIHFSYVLVWTFLAIWLPRDGDYYSPKTRGLYWRLPLEIFNVVVTFYFIFKEVLIYRIRYTGKQKFISWRRRELNRDRQFIHPRWAQEKEYLNSELEALTSNDNSMKCDSWNLLEFPTYISVIILITTRIIAVKMEGKSGTGIHNRAACFSLIFIWLHFLKSCRTFPALGIFITLLTYALKETLNFAGIYFLFTLPYTLAFWIVFGGSIPKDDELYSEDINVGWTKLNDLLYFSWQVTINITFDDRTAMMDRIMAQIIKGAFFAMSSVLCINVYIALLTETFNKVYYNAKAYAAQDQAKTILDMEKVLSKNGKEMVDDYIQNQCGPLEGKIDGQDTGIGEERLWEIVYRTIFAKLENFRYILLSPLSKNSLDDESVLEYNDEKEEYELYQGLIARDKELHEINNDLYELKCSVLSVIEPNSMLPEKPIYTPLKILDIKNPDEPDILDSKSQVDEDKSVEPAENLSSSLGKSDVDPYSRTDVTRKQSSNTVPEDVTKDDLSTLCCPTCGNRESMYSSTSKFCSGDSFSLGKDADHRQSFSHIQPRPDYFTQGSQEPIYATIPASSNQEVHKSGVSRVNSLDPIYETIPTINKLQRRASSLSNVDRRRSFDRSCPVYSGSLERRRTLTSGDSAALYDEVEKSGGNRVHPSTKLDGSCSSVAGKEFLGDKAEVTKLDHDIKTTEGELGSVDSLEIVEQSSSVSSLEIVSLCSNDDKGRPSSRNDEVSTIDDEDNESFRTIMNIKTTTWKYQKTDEGEGE